MYAQKINISIRFLFIAAIWLPSCKVSQTYQRPAIAVDSLYRDAATTDTATVASIPWSQFFNDTLLKKLIAEGIGNNYDLQVALARIKQAAASFRQSKAAFLPDLSANAQAGVQELSAAQGRQLSASNQVYQLGLSSNWEADLWGKFRSAKKAALASLMGSEAFRRTVQTQIVAEIVSDYYNLLALDKQMAITLQTIDNRKEDVETNKLLKEAAKVTSAAVVQSEANRYAAEVTIPDLKNNIRQIENAICVLLGRQPGPVERTSLDVQQPYSGMQTGIPLQLLAYRPDVQEAEYNVRFYFEQTNAARAYFYPALTITASGGWQAVAVKDLFSAPALFGNIFAGLTQPVFNRGLNRQRLEIAQGQYEENVAVFRKTLLSAGQEVSDALYSYQSAVQKANIRSLQLSALQKSVDYTRELLKNGYATYTDVLTSEQSLLSAQLSSVDDKLQQLTAGVTLYRSLGGGWK